MGKKYIAIKMWTIEETENLCQKQKLLQKQKYVLCFFHRNVNHFGWDAAVCVECCFIPQTMNVYHFYHVVYVTVY